VTQDSSTIANVGGALRNPKIGDRPTGTLPRREAALVTPTQAARPYRFFLFDGKGHTVRLRLAECEDATRVAVVARAILEAEEPGIEVVEAWDSTRRLCRVERPAAMSSKRAP
jgi:hypothetical protein